ncbi:Ribonuclease HI, partial [Phytophthora megakarya]
MGWYEYDSDNGYEYVEPLWFYAVAIGRRTGIFTSQQDATEQVHGFPGACMRKFRDYEEAREFLEDFEIYCGSLTDGSENSESEQEIEDSDEWFYAVAAGRSTGIFLNFDDAVNQIYGYPRSRMEQFLDYEEAEKFIDNYQIVFKEEQCEKSQSPRKIWFYAVAVGRSTGVFLNSAEAMEQVRGFSGFQMKKFRDFDKAEEYIAFNQVYSSDEESEVEEEKWYYAVAVGRLPGVYTDWEVAKSQVNGFSGSRMKKFHDLDEANAFIQENLTNYSNREEDKSEEPEELWYYAVAVGRFPGVYTDWEVAKSQVNGFSGSRMKKFRDLDEANAFIQQNRTNYDQEEEK